MKKRIYHILIVSLLLCCTLYSQTRQRDSLLKVLSSSKEDTSKIGTLNRLAIQLGYTNPDTAIYLCKKALALAEKLNYEPGIAGTNNSLGEFHQRILKFDEAFMYYENAIKAWKTCSPPDGGLNAVISVENIAQMNESLGKIQIAFDCYFRSLKIQEDRGLKMESAKTLTQIAALYRNQANYPKAIDYYLKARKINEEFNRRESLAANLNGLGNVYSIQKNNALALDHYQEALKLLKEAGDKKFTPSILNNIGQVYRQDGKYEEAIDYFSKALAGAREVHNKKLEIAVLGNLGNIFKCTKEYSKALESFKKTLEIAEEMSAQQMIEMVLSDIGAIYIEMANNQRSLQNQYLPKAEKVLLRSLAICDTIHDLEGVKAVCENLHVLESMRRNYKEAFKYYKRQIAAGDSISNDENIKRQTQTEMQYGFEKKEAQTKAEQEKKDLVVAEEKQKQKIIIISVSFGLALVFMLALVILRSLRQNQRKNKIITEQKELVEHQKELVEEKQKEILDSIHYARRIQRALITNEKYIARKLNELN